MTVSPLSPQPLPPERLRRRCDPASLGFATTADVERIDGLVGQDRALDALTFGLGLTAKGYNIFVLGEPGSGRHNAVRQFLEQAAEKEQAPDDWVYVHNFREPHKPRALKLPAGRGPELAEAMRALVDGLKSGMPAVFESEDYQNRRKAIDVQFKESHDAAFQAIAQKAEKEGLGLLRTETGFGIVPMKNGNPIEPQVFDKLPLEERQDYQRRIKALGEELAEAVENVPRLDKERREKIRDLNRQLAEIAVKRAMNDLIAAFGDLESAKAYIEAVREDLIDNAGLFVQSAEESDLDGTDENGLPVLIDPAVNRYKVNVIVSHDPKIGGDPVIYEDFPDLGHLIGRIEHVPHMGAMLTDFTLIKAGSLHRANGGILMVDAERLLGEPFVWQTLKRCLRSEAIAIESPLQTAYTVTAVTLEPDPIPLEVKVVVFGERRTYYLLAELDPDFSELFKVAADFEDRFSWEDGPPETYGRLIASIAHDEELLPLTAEAVAAVIERAARMVADQERLSLRIGPIADLLREADYWARQAGDDTIKDDHVRRAIAEQIRRLDRVRERLHEEILRDTIRVATEGAETGQVNGLSVIGIGNFSFGQPSRISARVRMGAGKVIDIEREVELGGPLHSKGVLILSGFLAARYAPDVPMSLAATLVFEQSYGGVEGDSASAAELFSLLSALADAPLRQDIAVTGSIDQNGRIQAIGGVNEKIEGFFDICSARGLTGSQGVMIPAANAKHLMLREDVVEACRAGKFAVYPIATADQGIALLTGLNAGERGDDGAFPADSVNGRVEARLLAFAEARRAYAKGGSDDKPVA
ncbi:MAG: hypothetical protein C0606_07345 [Hyphomicrobiales bacterium]|nr:MAG: hypothetical protein C0606_07345 [Hyphomicrobiales bacterium]